MKKSFTLLFFLFISTNSLALSLIGGNIPQAIGEIKSITIPANGKFIQISMLATFSCTSGSIVQLPTVPGNPGKLNPVLPSPVRRLTQVLPTDKWVPANLHTFKLLTTHPLFKEIYSMTLLAHNTNKKLIVTVDCASAASGGRIITSVRSTK